MDIITYSKISKLEKNFEELFIDDKSINLFDKDNVTHGYYFEQAGSSIGEKSAAGNTNISYVEIDGSGDYSWIYAKTTYGAYNGVNVLLFNGNKEYISVITGTVDEQNDKICHFTVLETHINNGAKYFGYTVRDDDIETAMIVKSSDYPSEYIPYYNYGKRISADILSIIEITKKSQNLFNKNGVIYTGKAINLSDGSLTNQTGQGVQYIPFEGDGTYFVLYPQNYYGQYNIKLCLYDDSYTFLRAVSGTKTVSENSPHPCYFTISPTDALNVAYIGYCFTNSTIDTAMVVKSTTYPNEYIPYYPSKYMLAKDIEVQKENLPQAEIDPLHGKVAVFDGDSICHAPSTGGWAKYIGDKNEMDYDNVGISGGTITAELYASGVPRHWVCRYIDTIHTNHPTLDYLILEGGTNDADLLTDADIGTLDQANFTTFDDTTFIGALESLFYKATNYYPSAKIGFIIAHRMGTWSGYGYEAGDSPSNRRRRKFFEIAIEVCKKWGIPYIDLWQGSPLCPKLACYYDSSKTEEENIAEGKAYTDGQHLTQVGYNIISPKIESWMKTL